MSVIKESVGPERARVFNLGDIAIEAKAIIARAEQQAGQILADARTEAERIRAEARRVGHDEGLAEGREEGQRLAREQAAALFEQDAARAGRALAEAVEQLAARKAQVLAEARQDLVALALAIAEKVVRRHIDADPEVCQRSVEAAVELAGRASRLTIRVNPADLQAIQSFSPQLAGGLTGSAEVQLCPDDSVERGGCRLVAWRDTGLTGEIDATIQTQLGRLADELLAKGEQT